MLNIFIQVSILILVALIVSLLARLLKQPPIIAYIVAGILVSPFMVNIVSRSVTVETFSQMGVAFLLFIVGLHLNPKVIKEVGWTSLIVGLVQIVLTAGAGFLVAFWLEFSIMTSMFIALALTFSSTIIITKIISDKRDLETLYGKISVGILIVQDLAVIVTLITLSYFSKHGSPSPLTLLSDLGLEAVSSHPYLSTISLIVVALGALVFGSLYVLPSLTKFVAKNQELLFLFSVGWCFLLASLFFKLGFSMEIGALLAGMSLSISPYHAEIASRVRPLRDFFLVIFFILLGFRVSVENIPNIIVPALIFSAFVLIFKFLVVMTSLGIAGYTKRTSFFASTSLTQVSEFSFILMGIVVTAEAFAVSPEVRSIIILSGLITISISTYLMIYSKQLFSIFSKPLSIFERNHVKERDLGNKDYKYFLFGHNRIGFSILEAFTDIRDEKEDYLVVDFNPKIVKRLKAKGIQCVYGDAEDTELLKDLKVEKAKMVVSTIPDYEVNLLILNKIRKKNDNTVVIPMARKIDDALKLYEAGADYVIMPHFLGGDYTAKVIKRNKAKKKKYKRERKKQIKNLKKRLEEGHEHPEIEEIERESEKSSVN